MSKSAILYVSIQPMATAMEILVRDLANELSAALECRADHYQGVRAYHRAMRFRHRRAALVQNACALADKYFTLPRLYTADAPPAREIDEAVRGEDAMLRWLIQMGGMVQMLSAHLRQELRVFEPYNGPCDE